MECRLDRIVDFPTHDVFVAKLFRPMQMNQFFLTTDTDVSKLKPLLFDMSSKKYWSMGGEIAKCWNVGKQTHHRENLRQVRI